MKRITIIVFLITSLGYSQRKQKGILFINTDIIAVDKQFHYAAGTAIGIGTYYLFRKVKKKSRVKSILLATLSATLVGLIKEIQDSGQKGNKFDWADLAYTGGGGLFGALTIDLLLSKKKRKRKLKKINHY